MRGPTCIFWADLTAFSLQPHLHSRASNRCTSSFSLAVVVCTVCALVYGAVSGVMAPSSCRRRIFQFPLTPCWPVQRDSCHCASLEDSVVFSANHWVPADRLCDDPVHCQPLPSVSSVDTGAGYLSPGLRDALSGGLCAGTWNEKCAYHPCPESWKNQSLPSRSTHALLTCNESGYWETGDGRRVRGDENRCVPVTPSDLLHCDRSVVVNLTASYAVRALPGRLSALSVPQRFPMKIHFVWRFCMGAEGA
jgi:hypothetical protein